ncbi:beta-N-acetylhexosaminidase [Tahibacter amnicola]|uniref:Beta-hexosaminidase n=1 Tax=Tahibacter amnicola TaxID=2976241 RepID=A0ABY6BPH1_9GAMM|nr:beta-N-acetylhexosaminidase [Tahibacter amnicola]UXI69672.1 beta-N-acetylhexosaminidase [Tahibacter amnicola]
MLVIGITGKELTAAERDWIAAPEVSGVILFTRNFSSREQVTALVDDIRALRADEFLLCVDQEGGPVQRFRDGFTRLPALARLGDLFDQDPAHAVALAEEHAWVMASEMRALDIDLSFAPVVDLKRGNRAIGERAFHADPRVVSTLTQAYLRGMHLGGMAATIKHFPGHGSVLEDTHFDAAIDPRSLDALRETDLIPFADGIEAGAEAIMLAHVTYPAVDAAPAGYSRRWIQDILRGEMDFHGVVFSDDIGMAAAESAGGIAARIDAHLDAGCDLVLVCSPTLVPDAIAAVRGRTPCAAGKLAALRGMVASTWESLLDNPQRARFVQRLEALNAIDRVNP